MVIQILDLDQLFQMRGLLATIARINEHFRLPEIIYMYLHAH